MEPAPAASAPFTAADLADPRGRRRIAAAFLADGVVRVRGALDPRELDALRRATAELIARGPAERADPDFFVAEDPEGERLHRVQYLFDKAPALLTAVAHPRLLALVDELLGRDFVVAGEALVLKQAGDGREVPIHTDCDQDHPALRAGHRFFNIDIYLDAARPENGCLLAAPGSHRAGAGWPAMAEAGFAYPGLEPVPMEAGDILLHDCRLVHGSRRALGGALRRTLYFEFHARNDLEQDGYPSGDPVPAGWTANRQRIVHRAIAVRRATAWGREEEPFAYRPSTPAPAAEDAVDLRPRLGRSQYI